MIKDLILYGLIEDGGRTRQKKYGLTEFGRIIVGISELQEKCGVMSLRKAIQKLYIKWKYDDRR